MCNTRVAESSLFKSIEQAIYQIVIISSQTNRQDTVPETRE